MAATDLLAMVVAPGLFELTMGAFIYLVNRALQAEERIEEFREGRHVGQRPVAAR